MGANSYQPFLGYDFIPNPAVIFPTVIANYDWEIFADLGKEYYRCLNQFWKEEQRRLQKETETVDYQRKLFDLSSSTFFLQRDENPKGAGRRPTEFLSLFQSFVCARYMDIEVNSRTVCSLLNSNPAFLERMNFKRIPSYRTIDRYDQIMSEYSLWEKACYLTIRNNITERVINPKEECALIVDTTHIPAKAKKGKVIKPCRECPFFKTCKDKILTDDNAGVLVKKKGEVYFAHKVGFLTPGKTALPLNYLVDRGERHDSKFLEPLIDDLMINLPEFVEPTDFVIGDGSFNSKDQEQMVKEKLQAQLVTPINPRKKKGQTNPARGIKEITPYGQPVCINGLPLFLLGQDHKAREYIWACPKLNPNSPEYEPNFSCHLKEHCSKGNKGRFYRTKADEFTQINWSFPQFGRKARYFLALRTTIEREFSWLKHSLKMESLWKRNKKNVIAHVAKCLISMHIVANVAHKVGCPQSQNKIKTFLGSL